MLNLGRTIDRILEIEPNLSPQLISLKGKWEKKPKKLYWKKLFDVLNTEIVPQHPKRAEIQSILVPKKRTTEKKSTFEAPTPVETVVGTIPENLECRLRRMDKNQIELASKSTEARMTHDTSLMLKLIRKTELLEIEQRKIWFELKDHFSLWGLDGPINYLVRSKDTTLILTCVSSNPRFPERNISSEEKSGPPVFHESSSENFIIRMDSDMIKRFFKFFNIPFPPGMSE
jgi:hypothetical protein